MPSPLCKPWNDRIRLTDILLDYIQYVQIAEGVDFGREYILFLCCFC